MKITKIFNAKIVLLLILAAFLLSLLANLLITCIERIIYPQNYEEYVTEYSEKYAVPKELIFAVIKVESNFDKDAVSYMGAVGLMQMLPSTAKWLAEDHLNESPILVSLYNPQTNIKYGVYYLQYLYAKFGSWEKAIIAYNWGEGNFSQFLEKEGYTDGEYSSIPVKETRNYVKKVMHHWEKYKELY